ncbi:MULTISPECIES: primase-like DNA-binding domain-containing protein [Bacillus cereus group]|uniref:primase-like DNA-binding domain-containing protein n=1 Tax=Bacillus cereus group TaxID=86661 RepID=UPI000CD86B55|nr:MULTISPECIES: primase-like DNA-binding domain-containing protein [Bacillus cereus group]MBG9831871.1 hypothetical protein [Bacillus wiedmannii]UOB98859.1 hypothetical protein BTI679_62600 [Bacillus wiedmannii]
MKKFIEENTERDIKSFELTDDLYKCYLKYCETYDLESISRRSFSYQLSKERIGAYHKFRNKPARWGVKLLPCKY